MRRPNFRILTASALKKLTATRNFEERVNPLIVKEKEFEGSLLS